MPSSPHRRIVICTQQRYAPNPTCCAGHGSLQLLSMFAQVIEEQGLDIELATSGCMGMCRQGPNLKLMPAGLVWNGVDASQVKEILGLAISTNDFSTAT